MMMKAAPREREMPLKTSLFMTPGKSKKANNLERRIKIQLSYKLIQTDTHSLLLLLFYLFDSLPTTMYTKLTLNIEERETAGINREYGNMLSTK